MFSSYILVGQRPYVRVFGYVGWIYELFVVISSCCDAAVESKTSR